MTFKEVLISDLGPKIKCFGYYIIKTRYKNHAGFILS